MIFEDGPGGEAQVFGIGMEVGDENFTCAVHCKAHRGAKRRAQTQLGDASCGGIDFQKLGLDPKGDLAGVESKDVAIGIEGDVAQYEEGI